LENIPSEQIKVGSHQISTPKMSQNFGQNTPRRNDMSRDRLLANVLGS